MKFNQRSHEKELLDLGPAFYSSDEYAHCQKMLFRVNKMVGFFSGTRKILKRFPKASSLLDVGCGGGLFLLHLSRYFPAMQLRGIDISSEAIELAQRELQTWRKLKRADKVSFKLQHLENLSIPKDSVDFVLTTMVCHHLEHDELITFLQNIQRLAGTAVIINDLHRHFLPHWFYGLISPFLFRNRLISHDGLISIRRGFTRRDWQGMLRQAGIHHYQIKWCFPFRWRVILWKN